MIIEALDERVRLKKKDIDLNEKISILVEELKDELELFSNHAQSKITERAVTALFVNPGRLPENRKCAQ